VSEFSAADERYMRRALELARHAADAHEEVPVGAVLVLGGEIVGEGWNRSISHSDPSAHAEICALREAGSRLANYRFPGATLYVTLEPCVMCAGALHWVQLQKLVFGASDVQRGYRLLGKPVLHPKTLVQHGVKEEEAKQLIDLFFKGLRDV
jgi:tRNA(adenine34) deaminase